MMWSPLRKTLLLAALLGAAPACGASVVQKPITPSSPFTKQDAVVFDDAVDLLADPTGIDGAWADGWKRDFDTRTERSDVIAIVEIETVISETDLEQRTIRLTPTALRVIRGRLPEGFDLRVKSSSAGYASIDHNRKQLMSGQFVMFAKWVLDGEQQLDARFHLAPASDPIIERIEEKLGVSARSGDHSHVIIRRN